MPRVYSRASFKPKMPNLPSGAIEVIDRDATRREAEFGIRRQSVGEVKEGKEREHG